MRDIEGSFSAGIQPPLRSRLQTSFQLGDMLHSRRFVMTGRYDLAVLEPSEVNKTLDSIGMVRAAGLEPATPSV